MLEAHPSAPDSADGRRVARRRRPASDASPHPAPGASAATRLFLAAADDVAGISAALADDDAVLAGTDFDRSTSDGPVRIAIADPTPKRLALARKMVARGQPWRGRNDIWFTTGRPGERRRHDRLRLPGIEVDLGIDMDGLLDHFAIDLPRSPTSRAPPAWAPT